MLNYDPVPTEITCARVDNEKSEYVDRYDV